MFRDLREFIAKADELGQCKTIEGAHWDLEIGLITEWQAGLPNGPMLLFDKIGEYGAGYRVAANIFSNNLRTSLGLGLPLDATLMQQIKIWRDRERNLKLIPPKVVDSGPVMDNLDEGDHVDLFKFPVPKWHPLDGGRYIGTGDMVITRDPEEGWVNAGTQRVQIHDRNTATIVMSPGRHNEVIRRKYWREGKPCPVAVSCGQAPLLWAASNFAGPWGVSEFDYAGGLAGEPFEVVEGPYTGLPIPARAEIVLEGDLLPPGQEDVIEGPFGEWAGYYTDVEKVLPAFKVRSIAYRNNPIIQGNPPLLMPLDYALGRHIRRAGLVWEELNRQIPGVKGVWILEGATIHGGLIISLKQEFAGHAQLAAMTAAGSYAVAYMLKWVIVVDDDIDPTNMHEVMWALGTRGDASENITVMKNCWGSFADPALSPEKRERKQYDHSLAIVLACKPYHWIAKYPPSIKSPPEMIQKVKDKWQAQFADK
jgi:4-hydroxy-3-polyprenylbenzoate decarboxylase